MKKYFLSIVALAGMLFATSCQESLVEPQVGGTTTFTVQVPDQMGTKADPTLGLAANVNQLFVAVYADALANNATPIYRTVAPVSNGQATVKLNLIQDQFYDVIFWAQVDNNYVSAVKTDNEYTFDLVNIPMNKDYHNTDNGAAFFYYWDNFKPTGTSQPVTLRRPFAQLNLGTTEGSLTNNAGTFTLQSSVIKVKGIADNFNTVSGFGTVTETNKDIEYTFDAALLPSDATIKVAGVDYKYVSMDYLPIVGDDQALITVDATITLSNNQSINHKFTNVPVRENYRTNIVGNLISSSTDFNVVVDDKFVDENGDNVSDDYNMLIWDGESIKVPSYDDATKTYSISNGAELAWLAATVSGDPLTRSENTPNSLAGKTVKLTEDIYLGENEWKPIGMGGKHFEGIFDGQGHTIYGLKVASRSSGDRAALFCSAAGSAQFKNFTIDGAKIIYPKDGDDYYAAGVVGTIYGNHTFENITVKNSRITGNNKVAGLIAHDGKSTQITINNCHILDSYIASEDLKDGGCVGGMIGYYATGVEGKENNIYNSSVEGCTIVGVNSSNSGKRANSEFIGSIKTNADMVLNITDCILERNTFTQTINGTDPVTYLSAFNPQYIGGDREEKTLGTITISINGETPAVKVTTIEQLQQVVNNATTDITVELGANLEGHISLTQKAGIDVTIIGNDHTYTGTLHIWGNGASDDRSMTIKNINFVFSTDSEPGEKGCIYTTGAVDGRNSYACNVTIEDCTFTNAQGVEAGAAIRQNVAGEKDWTIKNCTVSENMHSLLQVSNTNKGDGVGLLVQDCEVYSKNGANLNSTCYATFIDCVFDVKGYAVRVGVNSGGNPDATKKFNFTGCTLKTENVDREDAVIVIRKDAQKATLNFVDTELIGDPKISGYTDETQIDGIAIQRSNQIWYISDMALVPTTSDAFNGAIVIEDKSEWDSKTGKGILTFDKPITMIGDEAFKRITNNTPSNWMTSVSLPDGVKSIGKYAFYQCFSLTSITIPNTVESIGEYAFSSCQAATSVTIGSGVTSIASGAFYGCWELNEIICKATTPPAVADKWVFYNIADNVNVIVPASSVDQYKASDFWKSFNIVAE